MNLYRVQDDDRPMYVEAHNMRDALERWRFNVAAENPGEPIDDPEGIAFLCESDELLTQATEVPILAPDAEPDHA